MLLLLSALCFGQSNGAFTIQQGPLLEPADLIWGQGSVVGSPAVFRDEATDTNGVTFDILFMVYETQTAASSSACPAGQWGVGMAYSFDGTNFVDLGPIVQPGGTTYHNCVAAHPTVASLGNGTAWVVLFKAEQDVDSCTDQGWGCDRYAGVGRTFFFYQGTTGPGAFQYGFGFTSSQPVLQSVSQDMGYPSIMYAAGEWHMAFSQNPDLYVTSAPNTTNFTNPGGPVVKAATSASGWEDDELFSPSFVCESNTSFKLYAGGRDFDPYPTLLKQSVGGFSSSDLSSFTEIADDYHNTDDDGFEVRHLDMVTSGGAAGYGAYHTRRVGGSNSIWLGATPGFNWAAIDDKRCP